MISPKILANGKGFSPITTIILIAIIFIAIGGISIILVNVEERAGHAIQIQNVNFEESLTTIYVQNTGKGTVILNSLHIDDDEFTLTEENCTVSSEETTTVKETKTAKITITERYQKKIHVKVVCEDGTFIEADEEPPKS